MRIAFDMASHPNDEVIDRARSIAYLSDETGRPELYVRLFSAAGDSPVVGAKVPVSKSGAGSLIRWRADGKELFYP